MTMSTLTEEGVMAVKTAICEALLSSRVEMKMQVRQCRCSAICLLSLTCLCKWQVNVPAVHAHISMQDERFHPHTPHAVTSGTYACGASCSGPRLLKAQHVLLQGKRIQDVANRMHVAVPKARDHAQRPPQIPASVLAARVAKQQQQPGATAAQAARKLERELQVGGKGLSGRRLRQPHVRGDWCARIVMGLSGRGWGAGTGSCALRLHCGRLGGWLCNLCLQLSLSAAGLKAIVLGGRCAWPCMPVCAW